MSDIFTAKKTFVGLSQTPGENFSRAYLFTESHSPGGTKRNITIASAVIEEGLLARLKRLPLNTEITVTVESDMDFDGTKLLAFEIV